MCLIFYAYMLPAGICACGCVSVCFGLWRNSTGEKSNVPSRFISSSNNNIVTFMNAFTWGRLQDLVSCIYFVFDDENLRCSTMIYSSVAYLNRTVGTTDRKRRRGKRKKHKNDLQRMQDWAQPKRNLFLWFCARLLCLVDHWRQVYNEYADAALLSRT